MDPFQLPENLNELSAEELASVQTAAVEAFDALAGQDEITGDDIAAIRQLREDIAAIRAEDEGRALAAAEALAEIEALREEVHGPSEEPAAVEELAAEDVEVAAVEADQTEDVEVVEADEVIEAVEVEQVAAAAARPLNVGAIRRRQPARPLPVEEPAAAPTVQITAAADVPGLSMGSDISIDALVEGVGARARALALSKRPGSGLVASYSMPFDEHLRVDDPDNTSQGTAAVVAAADQSRLPGGDLVASGGWCAPSEVVYDIADVACPDMLWSAPEVQLTRGGIRFIQTPSLDVGSLSWIHTETDDIGDAEKPCYSIPCPDPVEVRCDAVGVCLESGLLTQRFFPELTGWYVRNSMVAHEIRIASTMFSRAVATSTHLTVGETFASFSAVYAAVALQAADLIEKHSLCDTISLEVTFPYWARNLFLADIARRTATSIADIDPAGIDAAFARLGVNVQWSRGLAPSVPTLIGGAVPADGWPDAVPFLIHPAGAFQIGRGATVDLGAVYDSAKFATNDFTALFTEECVALLNRGPESRFVTVPTCADGTAGKVATAECPLDVVTEVS